MTKFEFLDALRNQLKGLPEKEREQSIEYYREAIEDRIEDGADEQAAVAAIGTPEQAAEQILRDIPITKLVKERVKPKREFETWELVLLIIGSPVWVPLLLAAISVALAIYVSIWAVVISLYAIMAACFACSVVGIVQFVLSCIFGQIPLGLVMLGMGLMLFGIGIFLLLGANASAKGLVVLIKKMVLGIKKLLVGKERGV